MQRTIFITGATGYLGSYVANILLREHEDVRLAALVRAKNRAEAVDKMWRALQLHMDGDTFYRVIERIDFVFGDLTAPGLGIGPQTRGRLVREAESVLHIAASLNRKSEKACLNANLRGTLSVIKLAREIADAGGLRRYSHVSTVAVAGQRDREVVQEDAAIDWDRSDYDPYGRTKKFCEHMARELLPDVQKTFFRPSIVMGDSRRPETTQFDMVRAFCVLADMPLLPLHEDGRFDIVNADFVGRAIATLHMKETPEHDIYHLSAGTGAERAGAITRALVEKNGGRAPRFVPALAGPFGSAMNALASMKRKNQLTLIGSLFKVFLPYLVYDTVFDNERVTREIGIAPAPFTSYAADLYRWAKDAKFRYPYAPLPARPSDVEPHDGTDAEKALHA